MVIGFNNLCGVDLSGVDEYVFFSLKEINTSIQHIITIVSMISSVGQQLIESKIKIVYIIYVCVLCIFIMYI